MTRHFLFVVGALALCGLLCGAGPTRADQAALDEAKAMFALDGVLELRGQDDNGYARGWACPDFATARTVVALLQPGEDPKAKTKAFADIRAQAGCTAAKGRFQLTDAAPDTALIDWGYEAEEYWQALQVREAATGRVMGLVFDSSPFAP